MKKKKQTLTRYKKILSRADKKRPAFVKELGGKSRSMYTDLLPRNALVLSIKVLTPYDGLINITWSEKQADRMTVLEIAEKALKENEVTK